MIQDVTSEKLNLFPASKETAHLKHCNLHITATQWTDDGNILDRFYTQIQAFK